MKYIDADKLIAEIDSRMEDCKLPDGKFPTTTNIVRYEELSCLRNYITSLQQEQPNGKQVIIITETDGDANIHWDCRSLEDVRALLESAESYINDKQNEELRGCGSGPDYNTEEGRYSSLFKHRQEQPEVDLEKFVSEEFASHSRSTEYGLEVTYNRAELYQLIERMALVFKARKED